MRKYRGSNFLYRLIPQATSFLNLDLKGFDGDVTVFREISHRSKTYVKKPENSQKASYEITTIAAIG